MCHLAGLSPLLPLSEAAAPRSAPFDRVQRLLHKVVGVGAGHVVPAVHTGIREGCAPRARGCHTLQSRSSGTLTARYDDSSVLQGTWHGMGLAGRSHQVGLQWAGHATAGRAACTATSDMAHSSGIHPRDLRVRGLATEREPRRSPQDWHARPAPSVAIIWGRVPVAALAAASSGALPLLRCY